MARKPINSKMPTWVAVILALAMIATMGVITYNQWYQFTHPTPIAKAGAIKPTPETGQTPEPGGIAPATALVRQLLNYGEAPASQFAPQAGITHFRSASGNEVCAFAHDPNLLAGDPWVDLAPLADGQKYDGPAVVCAQVRGATLPKPEDQHACTEGNILGRSATLTQGFVNFGWCGNGRNKAQQDANSETNERLTLFPAVPIGMHLKLGDDFVCGSLTPDFVCAQISTGRAFKLSAAGYELIQHD